MLLDAMKTGYLESTNLNDLFDCMPEDAARAFITLRAQQMGGFDPFGIDSITGAMIFGTEEEHIAYLAREKDLSARENALLESAIRE